MHALSNRKTTWVGGQVNIEMKGQRKHAFWKKIKNLREKGEFIVIFIYFPPTYCQCLEMYIYALII